MSDWSDTDSESSRNTHVKSDIKKVTTYKNASFLKICAYEWNIRTDSSGYCKVNIVFTLDQFNASFILASWKFLKSWIYIYF